MPIFYFTRNHCVFTSIAVFYGSHGLRVYSYASSLFTD